MTNNSRTTKKLQAQAIEELNRTFAVAGVNQLTLAKRLKKSPAYVNQLLKGSKMLNLRNLGILASAVGARVEIRLVKE